MKKYLPVFLLSWVLWESFTRNFPDGTPGWTIIEAFEDLGSCKKSMAVYAQEAVKKYEDHKTIESEISGSRPYLIYSFKDTSGQSHWSYYHWLCLPGTLDPRENK